MRLLWKFTLLGLLVLLLASCRNSSGDKKLVVLGIDGADPKVLRKLMADGKLPNFSRLEKSGSFTELGTTNPPQSPVAWATFTTGLNPGGHGIFDFIHRNPASMKAVASLSKTSEDGTTELLRKGKPFWAHLGAAGISTKLIKIAANFPPDDLPGQVLSGMGTPDVLGSYGTFTYYAESTEAPADLTGGVFVPVEERDSLIRARLSGPQGSSLPVEISRADSSAHIGLEETELLLAEGEWSEWIPLEFDGGSGMARFYLQSCRPLKLYVSPVNIDPQKPLRPVSSPTSFSRHLCRCCDRFYTQGMPEETKALVHGLFSDGEFLQQNGIVVRERRRLFAQGLKDFESGLFFFYLSTPDIVSHLFWNTVDESHPGYTQARALESGESIEKAYLEADYFVGRALDYCEQNEATLMVLSDHGFAPFERAFSLNSWLEEQGYFDPTDWGETQAYGIGFNGLYLNLVGRERDGVVEQSVREEKLLELTRQLEAIRDPKDGRAVISKVYRGEDIYTGEWADKGPDLVVGYAPGYRASWKSVLGSSEEPVLADNLEVWSGDHLMDPRAVPGILLANRPLESVAGANLVDIAPTILKFFQVAQPAEMEGRSLL